MSKEVKTAIGKRLVEVRTVDFKFNQTQMAHFLGYSSQSHYSKVESGGLGLATDALEKIRKEKFIRPAWIMFGDGEKYLHEDEQKAILENIHAFALSDAEMEDMLNAPDVEQNRPWEEPSLPADDDDAEAALKNTIGYRERSSPSKTSILNNLHGIRKQLEDIEKQIKSL